RERADAERHREAGQERARGAVVVDHRDEERRQHRRAEDHQQQADDALHARKIHYVKATLTSNNCSTARTCCLSTRNRIRWSSASISSSPCAINTRSPRTTAPIVVPRGSSIS